MEVPAVNKCAVIILAAGSSSRLGKPKQLLLFKGKTLLQHAIDTALTANIGPVLLVVGANYPIVTSGLNVAEITIAINNNWNEGIASSIRCGVAGVQNLVPNVDAAIFMVCDQPHVGTGLLQNLVAKQQQTLQPIVASSYANSVGIPALFHQQLFDKLLLLHGDSGAKKIMAQHAHLPATIPFPLGHIDIDTLQDYAEMIAM